MSWTKLLRWAAIVSVLDVVLINVFAGIIPPLLVFALLWIAGIAWLTRATKGPAILLLVAFVGHIVLGARFVIPTLTVPASAGDFVLNVLGLIVSIVGIVAAVQVIRGATEEAPAARSLATVAAAVFVVLTAFSIFSLVTYDSAVAQEGDVEIVTEDIEFDPESIDVEAGQVSVFVDNKDTVLHTFTIDDLDVDLDIPAGKAARVTFDAEVGDYEFFCAPHKGDMEGTLTVQ
ncbi:MAG TPA: cupredoxin domain-containing protein [Actinomycetota bacterium]|nr:cupredoxin domain-containing protein [Actinomycetota bacterium]